MVLPGPGAEVRVLELGIVADLGAAPDDRSRSQVAERPDTGVVLDRRGLDDACPDPDARTDRGVHELAARPDDTPLADRRRTAQDHVRLERDVGAEINGPVEVHGRRVAHRHAVAHMGLVEPDPEAPFGRGQLGAIVDAREPAVVLEGDRD